ncbi:Gfo/Idh/MocA family protein [Agaribacter flavus]|uniref:Gfo/Idh/MocA family protein n=1 Tax=Agaribacter flavus TaxID=1902781 RepID=A0ABV7FNZ9_9ALTE
MSICRRQFLLGTAAGIGALSTSFSAFSNNKIGVALLGLGYYSTDILAPALSYTEHCELRGIITGSPAKVPRWQKKYGIPDKNVYTYETMSAIADNDSIDVVYVVTPTATHLRFATMAALAGKHVWCEKPMAMTVNECQQMIDVCQQNKVKLSIGYRMQHEPSTRAFAELSHTKPFGDLTGMSVFAGYPGGPGSESNWRMIPEMGGGALYDMGVYAINGARFISGLEPQSVSAKIEKTKGFKWVDATTYFTMKFKNGLEAKCGTSVVKGFNYLRANCASGWYELKPMQSYSGVVGRTSDGLVLPSFSGNQQAQQMDNDALAIKLNKPVFVPGEEGLQDIRVVEGAFKSARNNGELITL